MKASSQMYGFVSSHLCKILQYICEFIQMRVYQGIFIIPNINVILTTLEGLYWTQHSPKLAVWDYETDSLLCCAQLCRFCATSEGLFQWPLPMPESCSPDKEQQHSKQSCEMRVFPNDKQGKTTCSWEAAVVVAMQISAPQQLKWGERVGVSAVMKPTNVFSPLISMGLALQF